MVGTPTLTEVPPEMHHHTVSDNQVRAATLTKCSVSRYITLFSRWRKGAEKNMDFSAARKAIMPITAGTETFQEIGEELRGDGSMAMIISSRWNHNRLFPFSGLSYRHVCTLTLSQSLYTMAWQKTFTLAKRSKGCHLVTEEVLSQIEAGLNGVQV